MKRYRLEAELGQEHFCPPAERFRQGNFPPGGGNLKEICPRGNNKVIIYFLIS